MPINKVLIIRFSSFGDIVQASSVVEPIRQHWPNAEIHWVTRAEFHQLVALNSRINQVISLDKNSGFLGLLKLANDLRKQNYTHVYDAHHNLRSSILRIFLRTKLIRANLIMRPKSRLKRMLLFYFRINLFPKPFKGIDSYLAPLKKWGIQNMDSSNIVANWSLPNLELQIPKNIITFVPSAAWEMKRWPISHWKKLVTLLPGADIVILGGKEDIFCSEISAIAPERVTNLAGQISLIASCDVIRKSKIIVSADTGLLHVADVLGIPGISLMGPTAFGFTKSQKIKTLEVPLACRPCSKDGRGNCSQNTYQKCMVDITPEMVAKEILS
jgi:heptosyltransferase-2